MTAIGTIRLAAVFACLGASPPEWSQSDYLALLRLREGVKGNSREMKKLQDDAHKRAVKLGDKMLSKYRSLRNLSFRMRTVVSDAGTKTWHDHLSAQIACRPAALASSVKFQDHPLWWFFLKDGKMKQFKAPWNGVGGQRTEISGDVSHLYLLEGVNQEIQCDSARTFRTWVGKDNWIPSMLKERFFDTSGVYAGQIKSDRQQVLDVVISPAENSGGSLDNQWDAFYINDEGLLVKRVTTFIGIFTVVDGYYDFDERPISDTTFSPSPALLKQSSGWEKLTENDAIRRRRLAQEKD